MSLDVIVLRSSWTVMNQIWVSFGGSGAVIAEVFDPGSQWHYSISIDNNNWLETGDNSDGLYTFNPEFSAFNWENADNLLGLITFDTTSQSSRFYG